MTAFTPERIAQLREILAKATPGLWKSNSKKEFGPVSVADDQSYGMTIACGDAYTREDASAISAAVNTLPAALDEIEFLGACLKSATDLHDATLADYEALKAQLSRVKAERDEAVEIMTDFATAECDYMRINNLGDGEKQHNVKRARSFLSRMEGRKDGCKD